MTERGGMFGGGIQATGDLTARIRLEGLSLPVADVGRAVAFYHGALGLDLQYQAGNAFALIRVGDRTIGLLRTNLAGIAPEARSAIHVEFSSDDLDALYADLQARGVTFHEPPHDEPWERAMATRDPDGYTVEFAQGRRGRNAPTYDDA